jgi:hypothetical protein
MLRKLGTVPSRPETRRKENGTMFPRRQALPWRFLSVMLLVPFGFGGLRSLQAGEEEAQAKSAEPAKEVKLFDGKTLKGWEIVKKYDFERHGKVAVENGEIVLPAGNSMTGIVWKGEKLPTSNYEISLDARRREGSDFFCGLTFPVKDSFVSLVLGGWGGSLTGISSVDGFDASENETTGWTEFENGKWYAVRVRVTKDRLQAWVDKEQIVDVEITDRDLDVRWEMEPCQPLGIATYETTGGAKNIRLKRF